MRREEWGQQVALCHLLDRWLPDDAFFTANDPVAATPLSGAIRRKRGVKPGCPDNWVLHRGRLITIEVKSPGGRLSPAQRDVRLKIVASGGQWWMCRSANSAMWSLMQSGVEFREIEREDGAVERWEQPPLADWEVPKSDPRERRPQHPAWRRGTRRRSGCGGSGSGLGRLRRKRRAHARRRSATRHVEAKPTS
jgi:hypothetical protein